MATTTKKSTSVQTAAVDATSEHNAKVAETTRANKSLYQKLLEAPKETVTISPMYVPYLGDNCCLSICGFPVYVPCDGQTYEIPKPYADKLRDLIQRTDDQIRTSSQMADIANNVEQYAGERSFIRRV